VTVNACVSELLLPSFTDAIASADPDTTATTSLLPVVGVVVRVAVTEVEFAVALLD
jgi:hypothetical protein